MLTLEIEDDTPEIYLSFITSNSSLFKVVYALNKNCNVNFKKQKKAFTFTRNKLKLTFDFYFYKNNAQQKEWWILNNVCYKEDRGASLFTEEQGLETKHLLFKSKKIITGTIIHFSPSLDISGFKDFIAKPIIQNIENTKHQNLSKKEQHIVQEIYYDKQN